MKKLTFLNSFLLLIILVVSIEANAQNTDQFKFYLSPGGASLSSLKINKIISQSGGIPFHLFSPEFGVGLQFQRKRFQTDLSLQFSSPKKKKEVIPYKFGYSNVQLSILYRALTVEKHIPLSVGPSFAYVPMQMILYPQNNTISLYPINPENQQGANKLYIHSYLLGPSIILGNLIHTKGLSLDLSASYLFGIGRNEWKADNAKIPNAPIETVNQFKFSLLFFLFNNA